MDISYNIDFYNLTPNDVVGCLMYEDGICYAMILSAYRNRSSHIEAEAFSFTDNKPCSLMWHVWQDWHKITFVDLNGECFGITGADNAREF